MFTNRTLFFIKEHVGMLKLKSQYDIIDPNTKEILGEAIEYPGGFFQVLRLIINKRNLPTSVLVKDFISNQQGMRLEKSWGFFNFKVTVFDAEDQMIGYFKNKAFSFSGGFKVFDETDSLIAEVKGNWKTREYQLVNPNGEPMGMVTKKWAGFGKELFTTADNYMISIDESAAKNNKEEYGMLLLAASLAYDLVYTERS